MFRIDDPSASPTLPTPEAAGTEGYWTEGNPAGGVAATLERASWFNMIQEELRAIVVAGGLTPSKTTYNQVLTAIKAIGQANQFAYAADTGVANALVATLSPAPASLSSGMPVRIHVADDNTGASTLDLNGLGALPITGLAGVALQGGELKAGVIASFILSDDKSHWVLTGCEFGALQVEAATQSNQAVNLGQFAKSLASSGYQTLPSGLIVQWGTVAQTAVPSGVTVGTVTFPETFNSNVFSVGVTASCQSGYGVYANVNTISTSQLQYTIVNNAGASLSAGIFWQAIGR